MIAAQPTDSSCGCLVEDFLGFYNAPEFESFSSASDPSRRLYFYVSVTRWSSTMRQGGLVSGWNDGQLDSPGRGVGLKVAPPVQ
jgi:hypothetical protein